MDLQRSFILADIPGLIEGAHDGAGLGHDFLRHIQRSGVLVHLVEPMPMDESDPVSNYQAIREELQSYDSDLAERPEIVVVSKAELPAAHQVQQELTAHLDQTPVLVSALTGEGLNQLTNLVWQRLQEYRTTEDEVKKV